MKVVQKFVWTVQQSSNDWFSGVHENEGINKSHRFENQGHRRPISRFVRALLGGKGVEQHQPQELEQQNTAVHPVLSKLFLSVRAGEDDMKAVQATRWDVNMMQRSEGCCKKTSKQFSI